MAYTKKTWVNGEVIDAAKLNNIESGVAASENTATEAKTAATEAKADAAVAKTDAAEAKTTANEAKAEATEAKGNATEANTNALAAQSTADVNKQDIATLVEIASGLREDVNAAEANADEAKTNAAEALEKANGHDADLATMLEIMGGLRTDVNAAKTNADEAKTNATEAKEAAQQSVQSTLQVLQSFGNRVSELEENALTEADKPGIVTDTLNALAGADPNNATAAAVETLTGRTGVIESKIKNMNEDIAVIQRDVDEYTYSFLALHHPVPAPVPEDLEKMSFAYTSWMAGYDYEEWYDDITLMSPTGDVYAGRTINNDPGLCTREKLATEEYVQNALASAGLSDDVLGRVDTLERKVRNMAEDIATLQQEVNEYETLFIENLVKIACRLVQIERTLNLQPPISTDGWDTTTYADGTYDNMDWQ